MSGGGPVVIKLMRVIWLSIERGNGLPGAGLLVADDGGGDMKTELGWVAEDEHRGDGGSEQVDDDAGDHAVIMAIVPCAW